MNKHVRMARFGICSGVVLLLFSNGLASSVQDFEDFLDNENIESVDQVDVSLPLEGSTAKKGESVKLAVNAQSFSQEPQVAILPKPAEPSQLVDPALQGEDDSAQPSLVNIPASGGAVGEGKQSVDSSSFASQGNYSEQVATPTVTGVSVIPVDTLQIPNSPSLRSELENNLSPAVLDEADLGEWQEEDKDASLVGASVNPDLLHYENLDSMNDGPGNWFFKAQIMKRARLIISEIRKGIDRIQQMQEPNQKQADEFDARFDTFYKECGFQKGEIQNELASIEQELSALQDSARVSGGAGLVNESLPAAVAEAVKMLEEKRDALKEEQLSFDEVVSHDALSRQFFSTFAKEFSRAQDYLDVALEKYEKIENTLNDETAELALHAIEASKTNVINIEQYLQGDFAQFAQRLSGRIAESMDATKKGLEKLRQMGVELNKVLREEKEELARKERKAQEQKRVMALKAQEDARLINRMKSWFNEAWRWVKGGTTWFLHLFSSSSSSARKA